MMIQCRECGRDVSDRAASCPACGCPIPHPAHLYAAPLPPPGAPVVIEQTAKKYKGAQLVFGLAVFVGLFVLLYGVTNERQGATAGGGAVFCLAFVGYAITRLLAWWDHG